MDGAARWRARPSRLRWRRKSARSPGGRGPQRGVTGPDEASTSRRHLRVRGHGEPHSEVAAGSRGPSRARAPSTTARRDAASGDARERPAPRKGQHGAWRRGPEGTGDVELVSPVSHQKRAGEAVHAVQRAGRPGSPRAGIASEERRVGAPGRGKNCGGAHHPVRGKHGGPASRRASAPPPTGTRGRPPPHHAGVKRVRAGAAARRLQHPIQVLAVQAGGTKSPPVTAGGSRAKRRKVLLSRKGDHPAQTASSAKCAAPRCRRQRPAPAAPSGAPHPSGR